ncbi:LysR family transcriptional regulator [Novosphingobium sp. 1949]|uniref:LysR family transcriptional regulator n=1 Tax=Novosphingobium organovorum TaxID=2930092 RepID=A0ABT0BCA0_9SPHN|nr:LysR family transcriptional regulator [Novosphingobium organovorum]MCJ2182668.1 LysR family transcriptional regulator [Novosphingobium organovorum]
MASEPQGELPLRALRIFVTLAECGVMSEAAGRLGITQARVSQTIRSLEERFGIQLVSRDRRPVALTRPGQILHQKALELLDLEGHVHTALRDAALIKRPALHLAAATSFVDVVGGHLVPMIEDLASGWRITAGLSPDHVAMLLSRKADMIVTVDDLMEDQADLARFELVREPYVLALPHSAREVPDLAELVQTKPLIRYGASGSTGRQIMRHLARMNLKPVKTVEIESVLGQMTMIANNQGWGLTTPLCYASAPSFHRRVMLAPISKGAFRRQLTLICREREDEEAAARIAEAARTVLRGEVLARMLEDYPWLEDKFLV